jgi:hypothetical protein
MTKPGAEAGVDEVERRVYRENQTSTQVFERKR